MTLPNRLLVPLLVGLAGTVQLVACDDAEADRVPSEPTPDRLVLPFARFYPEGIDRGVDGSFYVTSVGTGAIARVAPGASEAEELAPAGTLVGGGVGVRVAGEALWACALGVPGDVARPSALYELTTDEGRVVRSIPLPAGGLCNDVEVSSDGTVYVTDSAGGRVLRLVRGASELEVWASGPDLERAPDATVPISVNGLALRDPRALYVGRSDGGQLVRIAIESDGSAGEMRIEYVGGGPPAGGFDGMRWAGPDELVAVVGGRTLAILRADGRGGWAVQETDAALREPTTLALDGEGHAWVVQSQLSLLFDGDAATDAATPFDVVRVTLPGR